MLEIEQHARPSAGIALVDQNGATLQEVAVALESEVDNGVEQRMPRAIEGGLRFTLRRHK
jgi:hypothetical protein